MSQAIITRRGGSGSGKVFTPLYTGAMNLVYTNAKQTGGYAEFTSSGTLTWMVNGPPKGVDVFCVGGGGGGVNIIKAPGSTNSYYYTGGGGGGRTNTVYGAKIGDRVEVTIGAGGTSAGATMPAHQGGTTSVGEICSAAGGNGPGNGSSSASAAINGGNGGSGGCSGAYCASGYGDYPGTLSAGGNGGTNGGNGTQSRPDDTLGSHSGSTGKGQGTPTTDLLGRKHAGGGASTGEDSNGTPGASDFTAGKGSSNYGGGGYGGGAPGGRVSNGAGGQGFAMIAWGTYKEDLGLT